MDARLSRIDGRRLSFLRRTDLPELARAIVGFERHQVQCAPDFVRETRIVRLRGPGVDVIVRGEDWDKIVPYLRDGTFNPLIVPTPHVTWLHPEVDLDLSVIDVNDRDFFVRVLGVLRSLFTEDYPISNL